MTSLSRDEAPLVTVVMPTFEQMTFLRRAFDSLVAQTLGAWRLIVVDDGSRDGTPELLERLAQDPRIDVVTLPENRGMAAAINVGLERAGTRYVAYLPSDDVYHADHLAALVERLEAEPDAVLAHSGVRHLYNRTSMTGPDGWLQPVQVVHRRTEDRWVERPELVTDDLDRLFWDRLRRHGRFTATDRVTCEWVDHPAQAHKVIRDPVGGINPYRHRYRVKEPLRFHSSTGNRIDEVAQYARFRARPDTPPAPDGLRILLVGELSYNPERVLALEERGHSLHGLWMDRPHWYTAVGPMPFGHVRDVPREGWQTAVRELRPDVVYALLNWQTVPFAAAVRRELSDLPFVWHFKEGPFICLDRGTWPDLVELTEQSDGVVHSSQEMADWFETVIPERRDPLTRLVLDGDLPKRDWFEGIDRSPRLSDEDGEIHTVVPGRPIGLHVATVGELAAEGIHLHFYGDFTHGQWREWIERAERIAPRHLHLHGTVDQDRWVEEFSRYDAGWLHLFRSENGGDIRAANWDDLNLPARMATLAAAGLPMIQHDNSGAIVATQRLTRRLGVGVFVEDMADLGRQLRDSTAMRAVREDVWARRPEFTFDAHADRLIAFFRRVIDTRRVPAGGDDRPRRPVPVAVPVDD